MKKLILYPLSILLFNYCSPSKFVKPLEYKQQAASVSFGGPLIGFSNLTIPVPFLNATYAYGLDTSLTGFASVNVTSALYGNFQTELGITKQVLKQKQFVPGISLSPVVNIIYRNTDAYKIYPQLSINTFWEYGKKGNYFYTGFDNWFELSSKRQYNVNQPNRWIFVPQFGHTFDRAKWSFNIETKIIAPNLTNQKLVVDYKTPFGTHGAFGVYIGYTRKF